MAPARTLLVMELRSGVTAPARARDAVRRQLAGQLAPATLEDLLLVVSEMVTLSAPRAAVPRLLLRVDRWPAHIRAELHDGGSVPDPAMAGGLLSALSSRWGVEHAPVSVWAELPV